MQRQYIKLRGVLIPVDWDSTGNTIALAVATNEEEEYLIDPTATAQELFSMLQEEVEIAGWYQQHQGGKNTISPASFRAIGLKNKYPALKTGQTVVTKQKAG